jgi:hypothetical protein
MSLALTLARTCRIDATRPGKAGGMTPILATLLVAMTAGVPTQASAQQDEVGRSLNFGLNLRAEATKDTNRVSTGLTFGLINNSALSQLSLDGGFTFRANDTTSSEALGSANLGLSYAREVANADLSFDARLNSRDLSNAAEVDDFDTGTGTRRNSVISAALNWGNATSLGFGLTAKWSDTGYTNTTDPTLLDINSLDLGFKLRADLSNVATLNIGLRQRTVEDETGASRDTQALDAGLVLARPRGDVRYGLSVDDLQDDPRIGLNVAQNVALAMGELSYNLGASRGTGGATRLTGGLNFSQELPKGSLSLGVNRSLQTDGTTSGADSIQTSTSLALLRDVTATGRLSLSLDWAEKLTTASNLATANTSVSAVWSQSLAQDWALDLGYTHRLRTDDSVGSSQSDSLFLELRRNFSTQF